MPVISLDLYFYGALASFTKTETPGYSNLKVSVPEDTTLKALLLRLGIPTEERGITFINGNLSALPGLQPDLEKKLNNEDRIAFFDLKSMWPFQYRHGVEMTEELSEKLNSDANKGLHHTWE